MGNTPGAEVDYVANVKAAYDAVADAENKVKEAIDALSVHAVDKVRKAFARVFGDSVDFPAWELHPVLLGTRLRFELMSPTMSEALVGEKSDDQTWISFLGIPEIIGNTGTKVCVFIPLSELSPTGISEI